MKTFLVFALWVWICFGFVGDLLSQSLIVGVSASYFRRPIGAFLNIGDPVNLPVTGAGDQSGGRRSSLGWTPQ